MIIEAALDIQLTTFPGLTALVGQKIYPMQADQSATLPYVTFRLIIGSPANVHGGKPTLTEDRWQFSAWGATYLDAKNVAAQVKAALQSFTGVMGGVGGVNVSGCLKTFETDMYEGDPKIYHCPIDFLIFHDAV